MFLPALILYALLLAGYLLFIATIIYHIKTFRPPGKEGATFIRVFLIVGALLVLFSLVAFIRVPWDVIKFL